VADFLLLDRQFLLARLSRQVVDRADDLLDGGMGRLEGFDHLRFAHLFGAGLDHDDAVLAPDDDEVELAILALLERGIDDVLTVHQADADAGNRLLERNLRQGNGRRRPVIARTSVSFSVSAERTRAMIWVSYRQPEGKSGRIGLSMQRLVSTSFSADLPSRLKKPPGIRPDA